MRLKLKSSLALLIALFGLIERFVVLGGISIIETVSLALLIYSLYLMYKDKATGAKLGLIILMLSSVHLVSFFTYSMSISSESSFNGKTISLGVELIALGLTILHYQLNKSDLSDFVKFLFKFKKTNKELESVASRQTDRFKKKFKSKSKEQLQDILNNDQMTYEAKEAAKLLLNDKL